MLWCAAWNERVFDKTKGSKQALLTKAAAIINQNVLSCAPPQKIKLGTKLELRSAPILTWTKLESIINTVIAEFQAQYGDDGEDIPVRTGEGGDGNEPDPQLVYIKDLIGMKSLGYVAQ
jgi:hypothetical protein